MPPAGCLDVPSSPPCDARSHLYSDHARSNGVGFGSDSLLERGGFELPVPDQKVAAFRRTTEGAGAFERTVCGWDREFESPLLQERDGMGQAARKWHHRRCSQLMECPDAPAERLEQVPRRPGPR